MKITRKQLREIILQEAKKIDVPAHFGGGSNLTVFGYKTKNFDICLSAVKLFEDLKKRLKGTKLEGVEKSVAKAARLSDQIFGIEKRVVKRGASTQEECDRAAELNRDLKSIVKSVLGASANDKLGYMKMHMREITKRKEK